MRDTILFDLDGTLLPMDYDMFMKLYFQNIGLYMKDKMDPTLLAKYIMESTEVVIKDKNGLSNEDKFMNHFQSLIGGDISWYQEQFIQFYQSDFEKVKVSTHQSPIMKDAVNLLKEKGYKVAVATNPLFPMIANIERLKWAGFEKEEFSYVSCFEDSSYTKPHIEYYEGVLNKIDKSPENCYMIGNDIMDDGAAQKLGMKTYIITDHLVNHHNLDNTADYSGSYQDFYEFVEHLPNIKEK